LYFVIHRKGYFFVRGSVRLCTGNTCLHTWLTGSCPLIKHEGGTPRIKGGLPHGVGKMAPPWH